jgi:hypothetical protein
VSARRVVLAYAPPGLFAHLREVVPPGAEVQDAALGCAAGSEVVLLGEGDRCALVAPRLAEREADPLAHLAPVRAVVLVGPTAPWAERVNCSNCNPTLRVVGPPWPEKVEHTAIIPCDQCDGSGRRRALGPMEPLRAWAEMARDGAMRTKTVEGGAITSEHHYPLRLIVTAHPEPAPCATCGGSGSRRFNGHWGRPCPVCSGTGRALGPAEVARELIGVERSNTCDVDSVWRERGRGTTALVYATREAHDREAVRTALSEVLGGGA